MGLCDTAGNDGRNVKEPEGFDPNHEEPLVRLPAA
jgi:hypothetical protein